MKLGMPRPVFATPSTEASRNAALGPSWHQRAAAVGRRATVLAARSVIDLIFPPLCAMCGEPLDDFSRRPLLCDACVERFERLQGFVCLRCAMPVRGHRQDLTECLRCTRRRYRFERTLSFGIYRGTLRTAIIRAKRSAEEPLAYALGTLLAERLLEENGVPADLVVPMPTHWRKRWARGGNGAEIIGLALARRLEACYDPRLLRARRATKKQGMLTPTERQRNVRRAFATRGGRRVDGARVLLVDDVMTTGATASEAARALRQAGAASVSVAVVARGVGSQA